MPIYEYECSKCHHHMEVIQKISDAPLRKCEKCGKSSLDRLISQSAFHLKGGGWYSDLYSSSSGKTESKSEVGSKDSKSDTKAEPKSEKKDKPKPAKAKSEGAAAAA